MADATVGVSYLTLAYLIEIAVVVNLAYRELKFPELDNKLHERVGEILKTAKQREIDKRYESGGSQTYKEYHDLKSLIEKNGEEDGGQWGNMQRLRSFFNGFIRTRLSLKIANFNILSTILILICCTIAAGYTSHIEDVYCLDSPQKWVWFVLLIVLIIMTCTPLLFIRLATLCEKHLLGFDNKSGLVSKLANRMFKIKDEEDARIARIAEEFKVRQ